MRILTNNTQQPVFSTQDIVSCSPLSQVTSPPHSHPSHCPAQGCEGGFPYLVAGRYAKDYGAVAESCSPYVGKDGACSTQKVGPQVSPLRGIVTCNVCCK